MSNSTVEQRVQRAAYKREYRKRNPEIVLALEKRKRERADARDLKNTQLVIKFGITIEDYERMHAAQRGLCLLCRKPEKVVGRSLAVDHCHTKGHVRGLLCGHCNRALGFFGHDWRALLRAATYLLRRS